MSSKFLWGGLTLIVGLAPLVGVYSKEVAVVGGISMIIGVILLILDK